MKKGLTALLSCFLSCYISAQAPAYFTISKDSTAFHLTQQGASALAALPLKCIDQEYPNKTGHTSASDSDHVLTPRQLHPAFYGCFDWHSCVHGHWMLVRLLKLYPSLPEATRIREVIRRTITPANIEAEVRYFDGTFNKIWERTYGWAWLLRLDQELAGWNDADGRAWHQALQPLTRKIRQLWIDYLPRQTYPNRSGIHGNTAFGMAFALDYARALNDTGFEKKLVAQARRLYGSDKDAPVKWEPDGSDFLSPSLEEADLMRRVLGPREFLAWFNRFISAEGLKHLSVLPVVSDRSDYQIVHLDGLCFSRSWAIKGIASMLPAADSRRKSLLGAAIRHLGAALPHVAGGNYGGEHWLASFAVYALVN